MRSTKQVSIPIWIDNNPYCHIVFFTVAWYHYTRIITWLRLWLFRLFLSYSGVIGKTDGGENVSFMFELTGGNWQKWKWVFLTCPFHEIYRDEAVGLKSCKNTWKITIFVKMWNFGQNRENLKFCQ